MSRSTLRQLKDNKNELLEYIKLYSGNSVIKDGLINEILISSDSYVLRSDSKKTLGIPIDIIDSVNQKNLVLLFLAILQPETSIASDQIIFKDTFRKILKMNKIPVITKGVSYPSWLRNEKSEAIIESDSIWLIDLFAKGYEYCQRVGYNNFQVIDATLYEGWNRLGDSNIKTITNQLSISSPSRTLVERYLDLLGKKEYRYILKNCEIRGRYLKAIASVLDLPNPVNMQDNLLSDSFQRWLDKYLDRNNSINNFNYYDTISYNSFTAFIFAEEMMLREIFEFTLSSGPFREDIELSLEVLKKYVLMNISPTPKLWYSRSRRLPELYFNSSKEEVRNILAQSTYYIDYAFENLYKLNRVTFENYQLYGTDYIVENLYGFMQEVQTEAKNYKSSS